MVEENTRTDNEVFEREPIIVTLGGREFSFAEPGNRRRRGLIRLLISVGHLLPSNTQKTAEKAIENDPRLGLDVVDAMLDVLYDALAVSDDDKKTLDDTAEDGEIIAAFTAVSGILRDPFGAQAETKPTRKTRRKAS